MLSPSKLHFQFLVIAAPLNHLTKGGKHFTFHADKQRVFGEYKRWMVTVFAQMHLDQEAARAICKKNQGLGAILV